MPSKRNGPRTHGGAVWGRLIVPLALALLPLPPVMVGGAASQGATRDRLVVDGDVILSVHAPVGGAPLYALGGAGLYRFDVDGSDWRLVGPPPPAASIAVGAGDPDVLLSGDRPPCAAVSPLSPLFRSVDGGGTWHEVVGVERVRPEGVWPERGLALAASCSSLWVSLDGGETWDHGLINLNRDVTAFAVAAEPWVDDGVVAEAFAVVTSEGGGSSLVPIDLANPATPQVGSSARDFWGLGAVAFDGTRLVLGTATGVWVSADAGASWAGGRVGLEGVTRSVGPGAGPIPPKEEGRRLGVRAVAIDSASPDRLYAGTWEGVFVSDDGGASWEAVPGFDGAVIALHVTSDGERLFVETESGIIVLDLGALA